MVSYAMIDKNRWVKNPAYGNFSILNNDLQNFDIKDFIC